MTQIRRPFRSISRLLRDNPDIVAVLVLAALMLSPLAGASRPLGAAPLSLHNLITTDCETAPEFFREASLPADRGDRMIEDLKLRLEAETLQVWRRLELQVRRFDEKFEQQVAPDDKPRTVKCSQEPSV
jgi:hypothetical protein